MADTKTNKTEEQQSSQNSGLQFERRDIIKGLAAVPAMLLFLWNYFKKQALDKMRSGEIMEELSLKKKAPAVLKTKKPGDLIRLGVIGYGWRGAQDVKAAGFGNPEWAAKAKDAADKNKLDKRFETYLQQDDLNLALTGVCDVFDTRREQGIASSTASIRPNGVAQQNTPAKGYLDYQDLLASDDIRSEEHTSELQSPVHIDAERAGKHVYVEKCMTRTMEEAHDMYAAFKGSKMKLQLGHHSRAVASHEKAREIIENDILGPITLVEVTTNRNSPGGAWVYPIQWNSIEDVYRKYESKDRFATPKTLDWDRWQGPAPNKVPFNLERYFRWRCWYDYGTGLSGDLLSHDFDAVNQIMDLGIPKTASSSGGIYRYTKANFPDMIEHERDVPDNFQTVFEYPERNLTVMYSATLTNSNHRGKVFMGHDATMEVGSGLTVTPDNSSTRYKQKIADGIINTSLPMFSYSPGSKDIDGVTSATAKYFAQKGLMYTYKEGKRADPTHLHVANGGEPRCNIEEGFEEAVACHMATQSYLEGRRVEWDPVKRKIV